MEFLTIIGIAFVLAILAGIAVVVSQIRGRRKMSSVLDALDGFDTTQKFMGEDGGTGIAVDEQSKQICLLYQAFGKTDYRIISYRDVLEAEITEDGKTITKTSRTSQVGGALLGGVLAGGVGAVIGGLSGKTASEEKVEKITLRIIVNDSAQPVHETTFLESATERGSFLYKHAIHQARHWHAIMKVVIKQADTADKQEMKSQPTTSNQSSTSELAQLADLLNKGLISREEFDGEKAKLLKR